MTQLQRYIDRYGSLAGPKLYHALQSRAAHIGSSRRRGREIETLTGRPLRKRSPARPRAFEPAPAPEPITTILADTPTLFPLDPVAVEA